MSVSDFLSHSRLCPIAIMPDEGLCSRGPPYLKFDFQIVNAICSRVVFSPFCQRESPKDLVLLSLSLLFAEARQFGL